MVPEEHYQCQWRHLTEKFFTLILSARTPEEIAERIEDLSAKRGGNINVKAGKSLGK